MFIVYFCSLPMLQYLQLFISVDTQTLNNMAIILCPQRMVATTKVMIKLYIYIYNTRKIIKKMPEKENYKKEINHCPAESNETGRHMINTM